jgi:hypothetical protein
MQASWASASVPTLASSIGPIIVATPANPSSTPAILRGVIRSSDVKTWATSTPQIGVVALRIEASPLVCDPQPNRVKAGHC